MLSIIFFKKNLVLDATFAKILRLIINVIYYTFKFKDLSVK